MLSFPFIPSPTKASLAYDHAFFSGLAELHVAWGTPGGTGTKEDPLKVNTAAAFTSITSGSYLRGKTLILKEGEYLRSMADGNNPSSQLPVEGQFNLIADGDVTIKLDPATVVPPTGYTIGMMSPAYNSNMRDVLIEGITFDANAQNINRHDTNGIEVAICGVSLMGKRLAYRYCKIKGIAGNHTAGRESFGLTLAPGFDGDAGVEADRVIYRCEGTAPLGSYDNALCVFQGYPNWSPGIGQILECTVTNWICSASPGASYMNAYAIAGGTFDRNVANDCGSGMRLEECNGLIITNSQFLKTPMGVTFSPASGQCANVKLRDCILEAGINSGSARSFVHALSLEDYEQYDTDHGVVSDPLKGKRLCKNIDVEDCTFSIDNLGRGGSQSAIYAVYRVVYGTYPPMTDRNIRFVNNKVRTDMTLVLLTDAITE